MANLILKDLEKNQLILIVAPSNSIFDTSKEILGYFSNNPKSCCIYVTIAKPYNTLINILKEDGIRNDNILFIDCISPISCGEEIQRAGNCIFCRPQSLTHLSIALTSAISSMQSDNSKLLILDTLSTLLLYNESGSVARFIHALSAKLRASGVKSIIFTLEEETDKQIIAQVTQFCDKVLKL